MIDPDQFEDSDVFNAMKRGEWWATAIVAGICLVALLIKGMVE